MDKKKILILLASIVLAVFVIAPLSSPVFAGDINDSFKVGKMNNSCKVGKMNYSFKTGRINNSFTDINKIMKSQQKLIKKMNKNFTSSKIEKSNNSNNVKKNFSKTDDSVSITSEEFKKMYKITVDLRPFGKDENNIRVDVKDKTVMIRADYKSEENNKSISSSLYQAFKLSSKVDIKGIKRERNGDFLIITIPKKGKFINFLR